MEEKGCPEGMLDSYLYEIFQLLEQMEEIVVSDENGEFFDTESINEMFRILHTIKGTSGIMMYDNIALAAHKLEDVFYYLRESSSEDISKAELAGYIFKVSDFITGELNKIKEGKNTDGDPEEATGGIDIWLEGLKSEIQEKGKELPPENTYTPPLQFYIPPVAKQGDGAPLKIDLGEEPEPGDYILGSQKPPKEKLVGVGMEKLERLATLVDKLAGMEAGITEDTDTIKLKKKLGRVVRELQETALDMRKAPIGGVLRKMNRVVYDVSRRLSKNIELVISGDDIPVDRLLAEQITDPLMHMVRNAVDHGIESIEERRKAGKAIEGRIELAAFVQDDELYLSVKDDGRGLEPEKIFSKAKEKGILASSADIADYTEEEIYQMITCPGFTTKESATEISGRGVGMDVVAHALLEAGGKLHIRSIPGKGTEMVMEIPKEDS